jgi:hypothetical protein
MKTKKKERKIEAKYKTILKIDFKGQTSTIELDETPHRHKDEKFDIYKERRKMNEHFKKMKKSEMFHESLTNIDKLVGKKGVTYIKESDNE